MFGLTIDLLVVVVAVLALVAGIKLWSDPLLRASLWPFPEFEEPGAERLYRERIAEAMQDRRRAPMIERELAKLGNAVADEFQRRPLLDELERLKRRRYLEECPLYDFLNEAKRLNSRLRNERLRNQAELRKADDYAKSETLLERLFTEAAFIFGTVGVAHDYYKIYCIDEWRLFERRLVCLDGCVYLIAFNRTLEGRPEGERTVHVVDDAQLQTAYRDIGMPRLGRADVGFQTASLAQFNAHELQELAARGY